MQETQQQPGPPSPSCPFCGAALRGQVAYCPSCGATLLGATGRLSADHLFIALPQAIGTRFVRIVIVDTYPPPPAPDGRDFTPISEVVVEGTP